MSETLLHAERMERFRAAGVYLVTSQEASAGRPTLEIVQRALAAGIRLVQLREKQLGARRLYDLGSAVRRLTREAGALMIVNDRLDLAMALDADGVHLGQEDLPIDAARRLAPDLVIGASSHNRAEAEAAEREGASYVNIGPLFPTRTKAWDGAYLGMEGFREVRAVLKGPFTVMGGIGEEQLPGLAAAGAQVVAVVSAITAAPDPGQAASRLLERLAACR
jgi:thiamine-phosphate pyrophosphorylase